MTIGVPAAKVSCTVAPPALLTTMWLSAMSRGMSGVQPRTVMGAARIAGDLLQFTCERRVSAHGDGEVDVLDIEEAAGNACRQMVA